MLNGDTAMREARLRDTSSPPTPTMSLCVCVCVCVCLFLGNFCQVQNPLLSSGSSESLNHSLSIAYLPDINSEPLELEGVLD